MKMRTIYSGWLFFLLFGFSCITASAFAQSETIVVASPEGINEITFTLTDGIPYYSVTHNSTPVILQSRLGFELADQSLFDQGFSISNVEEETIDYTWTQPWGEVEEIRDYHYALGITLQDEENRSLRINFRAYDDGIAFRYEILEQDDVDSVKIMDEVTEFRLSGDHSSWWIPAYAWNRYEYLYQNTPISEVDTVHTPVTMETVDGLFLSFHEAALTDYSSMTLANNGDNTLECDLVPWSDGVKVRGALPLKTPWRTIQIAESAGDLITSYLILNCNEPCRIEDTSWIHPGKYVGIWWGMHIDIYTWASGEKHGATTENTRRYIDFASENGFHAVLVEGWNIGWDGDWIANSDSFDFCEPYPDYDLYGLAEYARERGVGLIAHNETSGGIYNYERQMEDAFALYQSLGIHAIKSGYVMHSRGIKRRDPETGELLGMEWHHGQYMVNHYRHVVETAARYQIMLDVHEPIKPTGIRRTWPNMMTREGARGQEFNAWDPEGGNGPAHTTIIPFTRCLAGPFDFTPGIFDLRLENDERENNRIPTTLAKQIALYVTIYSPWHMAADLPENYEGHQEFEFIQDVPTDWSETVVLNAEIGEYLTIARKDRNSNDWYLGSITNENGRDFTISLDFLEPEREYTATIYADAPDAHWDENPLPTEIRTETVTSESELHLILAPGGGQAIHIHEWNLLDIPGIKID